MDMVSALGAARHARTTGSLLRSTVTGIWRPISRSITILTFLAASFAGASLARATTVVPPDFERLVAGSECVVHAVVKSVRSEKRPSASGNKIVTLVELDVKETMAGKASTSLTLQFLGGRVGTEELRIDGMPRFQVGDEDVLFVKGNGRSICPLPAMMHGRYPVRRDAAGHTQMLRADRTPLLSTAEVSAPLAEFAATRRTAANVRGLDLGAFKQQIRNVALTHEKLAK